MFTAAPAPSYGGYGAGAGVPGAVWRKLRQLQGRLRDADERARKAEAALGQETQRRKKAEAALAAERRKCSKLREREPRARVDSPRARGATVALPDSPRERGLCTHGESPRARGAALALPGSPREAAGTAQRPKARGALLSLPDSPRLRESAGPDCQQGAAAQLPTSPRTRGSELPLESPRTLGTALRPRETPRALGGGEVGSPRRGDAAAAAAAPCTPPQSPDRSELELTPGPLSPDEHDTEHPGRVRGTEQINSAGGTTKERRRPDSEALFIDAIAHRISEYTRRSWAPVCSTAARAVYGVLDYERTVWDAALDHLASFHQPDFRFGHDPEGHLLYARQELLDLKQQATQAPQPTEFSAVCWTGRWYCCFDVVASIYEHIWLQYHQIRLEISEVAGCTLGVNATIWQALHQRDVRLGLAEPESDDW
eukprot:TRINITY_DN4454_c0_g2_i5.p1 TRINITY_DN4454_c0_g2~~TRINITY_DN4454_c0_g2_i5.p1  ORF type:complete len:428 (+),score=55.68 TRINITY_DN4454_c0_g2_i5:44-1327(+)